MSRGFVKEDDQEEVPLVPPRAYLPDGVTNFVTPAGMDQLLSEKLLLIKEKEGLNNSLENDKRITVNYINAKLRLLENRIAQAKVVNLRGQPQNEIRFGATVTLNTDGISQTFQIVGVDEADASKGKISFISPMARLLVNKKTGDRIIMKQAGKDKIIEVVSIRYWL